MKHIFQFSKKKAEHEPFALGKLFFIKEQLLRLDYIQVIAMLCLVSIGLTFVYSTGQQVGGHMLDDWKKQLMWFSIGLVFWFILSFSDYKLITRLSPIFYIVTIILLILVLIIGTRIFGSKRWLSFGGISMQPSEFAKTAILLLSVQIASLRSFKINKFSHFAGLCAVTVIPFLLVLKEPDLGSSLVYPAVLATIFFLCKIKWRWIIITLIAVSVLVPAAFPFLKGYQKERILVFLNPDRDPLGQGWSSRQTMLAVGSGGLTGKGIMQGTQNTLGFLPQTVSNSDFIFSVIAEETGFLGTSFLILCYVALVFSAIRTAIVAYDKRGYLLAGGIAIIFFEHSFINIGMNIRLMPVTGIPLPLISYGGSFMLNSMICLGLLQSIYVHRQKDKDRLD